MCKPAGMQNVPQYLEGQSLILCIASVKPRFSMHTRIDICKSRSIF